MLLGTNSYAPHVLSAAQAYEGLGRRRLPLNSTPDLLWYTTWVLRSGSGRLRTDTNNHRLLGPCALVLPPGSSARIELATGCEFEWLEWGITTAQRIPRGASQQALRYARRTPQPDPLTTWGVTPPIAVADHLYHTTASMVRQACARWYMGPLSRAACDAALATWIIHWLEAEQADTSVSQWIDAIESTEARAVVTLAAQSLASIDGVHTWAELANYERHRLARTLSAANLGSPLAVLNRLRSDRVIALITSGHPTDALDSPLGFHKYDTFRRWFVRQFGIPPSAYVRTHTNP